MTKNLVSQSRIVFAMALAAMAVAAPAAFAAPDKCPAGSHGVVVSNPIDKTNPLFVCQSIPDPR